MSMSIKPIWKEGCVREKDCERSVVKVDLPTPPLPDRISSLWRICERRAWIGGRSGSGPFGAVEQMG